MHPAPRYKVKVRDKGVMSISISAVNVNRQSRPFFNLGIFTPDFCSIHESWYFICENKFLQSWESSMKF
jgi:hypothetical protein